MSERQAELATLRGPLLSALDAAHGARERGLTASRRVIQLSSRSIRAVHRNQLDDAARLADEAGEELRAGQQALEPHPKIAHAGFLYDAAKEYAEARLTAAFATHAPLPSAQALGVDGPAWLNGLAEAASEMRRFLLDRLRAGELDDGERLLDAMDDTYEFLIGIDFPDALTGGLRRTTDAYRAVLERTRSDFTTAVMQHRLQRALEARS